MRNHEMVSRINEYPNYRVFACVNGTLVEIEKVETKRVVEKHHVTDRFHSSKTNWQFSDELGSFEVIVLYD